MGCDIHMIAEAKIRDEWQTIGRVFDYSYYNPKSPSYIMAWEDGEEYEFNERFTTEPYVGRNYSLFAILANVRNGRGFAGIKTGEGFNPISDPKGIPEDASFYSKKFMNSMDSDGHSHSYFTLQELLDYDWDQVTQRQGVVDMKQYRTFKEKGKPNGWSGGVFGGNIKNVSLPTMDSLVNDGVEDQTYYTTVTWKETYRECVGEFLDKTVPALQDILNKSEQVDDVRILFFFDN